MAKILISPLGTGSLNKDNTSAREYRKAIYKINGKEYKRSFVSSVLQEHLQLDGIFFIGTVKSMWEEVYNYFCKNNNDFNDEYYIELADKIQNLNSKSELSKINLSNLEKYLGTNYKCILVHYGLNEEELKVNFEIVLKAVKNNIQDGDELYIDITHSFRSLSFYLFLVMMFVKDLMKKKNIKIKGIYYGMLDIIQELGYAPITDMSYLLTTLDYIKSASEFQNYGNAFLLSDIIKKEDDELSKMLQQLSKAISINYTKDIIKAVKTIENYGPKIPTPYSFFLPDVINSFTKSVNSQRKEYEKEYELAKWHYQNKNLSSAYILLAESIVTYICENEGYRNIRAKQSRENAKTELFEKMEYKNLLQVSKRISEIRNNIAHNLDKGNLERDFSSLGKYLAEVKKLFI